MSCTSLTVLPSPDMIINKKGHFHQADEEKSEPNWLSLTRFEAETTVLDKVSRVVNNISFAGGIYGIYALSTGVVGMLPHAFHLSLGFLAARKIVSATIGYLVYPAACRSLPFSGSNYIIEELRGKNQIKALEKKKFTVRKIALNKSGTKYDAVLITHPDTIKNGNWTINALGNGIAMESFIEKLAMENFANKCNTLLVNGPSVGSSGGWPTRYQMGAGFESGLKFLEHEVKATHIVMHGFSLGAGMIAEAILNHDFTEGLKKEIRYLSISDRTFSRLSTIAAELIGRIVKPIFYITGTELDGLGAAKKLSELGIQQIVIQHSSTNGLESDSVIPDSASLTSGLRKDNTLDEKIFLGSASINHNAALPENIEKTLKKHIKYFVEES